MSTMFYRNTEEATLILDREPETKCWIGYADQGDRTTLFIQNINCILSVAVCHK